VAQSEQVNKKRGGWIMQRLLIVFISILVLFPIFSVGWVAAEGQSETVSLEELKQMKAQIEALEKKLQELTEKQVQAEQKGAVAQEGQIQQEVSKEVVVKYKEIEKEAKKERKQKPVQENKTGTDPRDFSLKWMPYYRYTELDNGLTQQDLTALGTVPFTPQLGMFYEVPLAQYRDFSDVSGYPSGADSDSIGLGDMDLKFLYKPKALEFTYGKGGEKSGNVLLGTDFLLPTATDDKLAGNALLFAPILGFVFDMPLHGFFAALNLYYFDLYKKDSAPDTSRYVGRWFYMQPLTPPGPWWGGLYIMPEVQPIYDFETADFSFWVAPEFGKMFAPGKIGYIKPGWGIDNSETTDRKFTFEVGFRWFF
jgi:hypothetical protein